MTDAVEGIRVRLVDNHPGDVLFGHDEVGALVAERDRLAVQVASLRAQVAGVWDEGFTKAGRLIVGFDQQPWPPAPNPYRALGEGDCRCEACPGRGTDGHGHQHCAECCFGTGVLGEPDCPVHGVAAVVAGRG